MHESKKQNVKTFAFAFTRVEVWQMSSRYLPVAEVQAGEDNSLKVLFFGDTLVRHVSNQQVDENHVSRIDEGDVLNANKQQK